MTAWSRGKGWMAAAVIAAGAGGLAPIAEGVVVSGNTRMNRPDGAFVGYWNGSSCVAVGKHWFISAKHVQGVVGQFVTMHGQAYQVLEIRQHPSYDIQILRVAEELPGHHKLDEDPQLGDPVLIGGFGVTTAAPLANNAGWDWNGQRQETWGANMIEGTGGMLAIRFDRPDSAEAVPDEAVFGVNDSGAGMFTIADDGSLELAGVAVSVMNYGSSPWGTVAFALNTTMYRSWLLPIVDTEVPMTSGMMAPRAMIDRPGATPMMAGAAAALLLACVRRRR